MTLSLNPARGLCCALAIGLSAPQREFQESPNLGIIYVCDTETQLGTGSSPCSQMLWEVGFLPSRKVTEGEKGSSWAVTGEGGPPLSLGVTNLASASRARDPGPGVSVDLQ